MRHSDVNLTMNTYTDPKLLDVAGAVEALPALPLAKGIEAAENLPSATGTDDSTPSPLIPGLIRNAVESSNSWSIVVAMITEQEVVNQNDSLVVSACPDKRRRPLTTRVNGLRRERETGFEPATSSLGKHEGKPAFSAQNRWYKTGYRQFDKSCKPCKLRQRITTYDGISRVSWYTTKRLPGNKTMTSEGRLCVDVLDRTHAVRHSIAA